jgi:hypothetical protein
MIVLSMLVRLPSNDMAQHPLHQPVTQMVVLLSGVGLFLLAFFTHIVIWRIRPPQRQLGALLLVFFAFGAGAVLLLLSPLGVEIRSGYPSMRIAMVFLLFGSFSSVYFILFSAVEGKSPSLMMIDQIYRRGQRGIGRDELLTELAGYSFAQARINDMLRDGLAVMDGDKLKATKRGRGLVRLILTYRQLLGRREAGG